MERVRSFIAVELPEELKAQLVTTQQELALLRAPVRWASMETLHLTLKFLGDVPRSELAGVARAVEEVAGGREPYEAELVGLGQFPALPRPPRVIWAGVGAGGERVVELAEAVERALASLGFKPENRRFHPHVTLGRVKSSRGLEGLSSAVAAAGDRSFGAFAVDSVVTFESELLPGGPSHTVVATAPLGGRAGAQTDAVRGD